jgi:hypothetical protein
VSEWHAYNTYNMTRTRMMGERQDSERAACIGMAKGSENMTTVVDSHGMQTMRNTDG